MKKINKEKHSIFVGMDVDKDNIDVAVGEEGRTTKTQRAERIFVPFVSLWFDPSVQISCGTI